MKKVHLYLIRLFSVLLFILFFLPLSYGEFGFYHDDYVQQIYPWLLYFAEGLKHGMLHLWTPFWGAGLNLFAEGQVGVLYPLNLLLFKWLPFNIAYNWMFILHFVIAYAATWIFMRMKDAGEAASFWSATVFVFASSYAGCHYNIVVMRSVVWFPVALIGVEFMLRRQHLLGLAVTGAACAVSLLAGAPQTALYSLLFVWLFAVFRMRSETDSSKERKYCLTSLLSATLLAVFAALPQLWATWQAGLASTRSAVDPSFILWGSVAPWNLLTLLVPGWHVFLKCQFYLGIPALIMLAVYTHKKGLGAFWIALIVALLMSLGQYNPLYYVFMHLPGSSMLRNPAKFLIFASFFAACLSGFSLDTLRKSEGLTVGAYKRLKILLFAVAGLILFCITVTGIFSKSLMRFGQFYLEKFVLGKSHHRHSVDYYLAKLEGLLQTAQERMSLFSQEVIAAGILIAVTFMLFFLWKKYPAKKSLFAMLLYAVLCADLFYFAVSGYGVGFIRNVRPLPQAVFELDSNRRVIDIANNEKSLFRTGPNILQSVPTLNAYSPILSKQYAALFSSFGITDDGFGRMKGDPRKVLDSYELFKSLGVTDVITGTDAVLESKFELAAATDIELHWRLKPDRELAYFADEVIHKTSEDEVVGYLTGADFRSGQGVLVSNELPLPVGAGVVKDTKGILQDQIHTVVTQDNSLLVRSIAYDPAWKVYVDGQRQPLIRVNQAFSGVYLSAGEHEVRWLFDPKNLLTTLAIASMAGAILSLCAIWGVWQWWRESW